MEELADGPAEMELGMSAQTNPDEILQATTAGVGSPETCPTSDPPPPTSVPLPKIDPGDDEYGAELGKDARFWKTYVKEADQWDAELVDGWSKSLDVILIFAALFSAISTAFVIESAKGLQPDPTEASAQSLLLISRTLLAMSSNNQSALSTPAASEDGEFTPPPLTVFVNVLWFLSLSLSVSVSLVAMLAKEWCYSYMSGRTGHPCHQARRRQQRWDGLVRWKMQELLIFLPSLIHMALLLFAIGLSIYLWNIHYGVAIPVIAITTISLGLYTVSTVLPLLYGFCPYNTTLSRLLGRTYHTFFPGTATGREEENPKQDDITSRALHWLIVNCEVPRSVDMALQAIAGATESLPKQLLKDCDAAMLICRRLTASNSYVGNYQRAISLYTRALAFLQSEHQSSAHAENKQMDKAESGRMEVMVWHMQSRNEREVVECLGQGNFKPTVANLNALRIGSTAASNSLRIFHNNQDDTKAVELATSLLEEHIRGGVKLHPAALLALVKATAMLLCCASATTEITQPNDYLMRLVRVLSVRRHSDQTAYFTGIILSAYALSQRDYPGWRLSHPLDHGSRVERAMEMIEYHTSPATIKDDTTLAPLFFGLSQLICYCEPDNEVDKDYNMLLSAFASLLHTPTGLMTKYIHTLSLPNPNHGLRQRIIDVLTPGLSYALKPPQAEDILHSEPRARMYLSLLSSSSIGIPIYALVIESLSFCQADLGTLKRASTNLLRTCNVRILLEEQLNEALVTRDVPTLLLHTITSTTPHDPHTILFDMTLLWQYVTCTPQPNVGLNREVTKIFPSRCGLPMDSEHIHLAEIFFSIIRDIPITTNIKLEVINLFRLMLQAYPHSDAIRFACASFLLRGMNLSANKNGWGRFKQVGRHIIAVNNLAALLARGAGCAVLLPEDRRLPSAPLLKMKETVKKVIWLQNRARGSILATPVAC